MTNQAPPSHFLSQRVAICNSVMRNDNLFATAFYAAPVGMVLATTVGKIIDSNHAFAALVGYSREELFHRDCATLAAPHDFEATRQFFLQFESATDQSAILEKRFLRKSGELVWVRIQITKDATTDANVTLWILVFDDITVQRQLEIEPEQLDTRFLALANAAPVMIWIADASKTRVWLNRPWLEFTGRTFDQDCGFGWVNGVHPADRDSYFAAYEKAIDSREPFRLDYRLQRHDGTWRWILDHGVPRYSATGAFIGYIGSCIDITDRQQAEQALRENEARLRISQAAGGVGCFEWWIDQGQILWTPTLEALYGLEEGSFAGTLDDWALRINPEDYTRIATGIRECIAQQQQRYSCELRAILPDGQQRWLRAQAMLFFDDAGRAVRIAGVNIDIDNQKFAEAQLRQQWQNFDMVLSNSPDFSYVFDLKGRFTYANRALLDLWGKPLDEVIGKNFYDLDYEPDLAVRLTNEVHAVAQTGQKLRSRTAYAGPSGESRFYEYIFAPVTGPSGQVEAVVGSTRDITENNLAETLLEEDRRKWRELLLQTPAAIAILKGPEHRFVLANNHYCQLAGRSIGELIGKSVLEALPEVADQKFIDLLDHVFQKGEPFEGQEVLAKLKTPTGALRERFLNFVFLPTRESSGEVDGVFVHAIDVTEGLLARKLLEENELQFRTLAESIPHLACMADESGHVFWYNRRWYDYTGLTLEQMQGWGWQRVQDPQMLDEVTAEWKQAVQTGMPFEKIIPLRGADGLFRTFLTRVEPVRDRAGKVVRWFGTNTDITDQQRIEAELRRSNRELEEFAYVASHDLQEPLRMVSIYTQQILKNLKTDDPKFSQYAEFVRNGVARMQSLIQDLLSFSMVVQPDTRPASEAHLSTSLLEALTLLDSRIQETGAVINRPALPVVSGDTFHFAQVFQNLLSNAIKYSGGRPLIEIGTRREGNYWVIVVRDEGIGFEQQYAQRIFGLFKRLHNSEYPGTGLGLAICQRIVERYGGKIWAESKPGCGSTFYFSALAVD